MMALISFPPHEMENIANTFRASAGPQITSFSLALSPLEFISILSPPPTFLLSIPSISTSPHVHHMDSDTPTLIQTLLLSQITTLSLCFVLPSWKRRSTTWAHMVCSICPSSLVYPELCTFNLYKEIFASVNNQLPLEPFLLPVVMCNACFSCVEGQCGRDFVSRSFFPFQCTTFNAF